MKLLLLLANLTFMYMNDADIDIEDILGYNSRRIVSVPTGSVLFDKMRNELVTPNYLKDSNWYIKGDIYNNFYWVFNRKHDNEVLFKYYGTIDDIESIRNHEPISKKVAYIYYDVNGKTKRVISIVGYDAIQAILNFYSLQSKKIYHKGSSFVELKKGAILHQDFIGTCKIYPDLQTYDFELNFKVSIPLIGESVYNYEKNILALTAKLGLQLKAKKILREDLIDIASKSFDYNKKGDISKFYLEYCSLVARYLKDTFGGELRHVNNELYFTSGKLKYDIGMIVSKTMEYIVNYEYNPDLYFQIFPELD